MIIVFFSLLLLCILILKNLFQKGDLILESHILFTWNPKFQEESFLEGDKYPNSKCSKRYATRRNFSTKRSAPCGPYLMRPCPSMPRRTSPKIFPKVICWILFSAWVFWNLNLFQIRSLRWIWKQMMNDIFVTCWRIQSQLSLWEIGLVSRLALSTIFLAMNCCRCVFLVLFGF